MGRPKGAKNLKAGPAREAEPAKTVSKAEAVRQALAAGLDGLDDIAKFVKAKHGYEIPKPQISAYKAQTQGKGCGGRIEFRCDDETELSGPAGGQAWWWAARRI